MNNNRSQDQADLLRERIKDTKQEKQPILPPRSITHVNNQKIKLRLRYPVIRLFAILSLLLILLIPGYNVWKDRVQKVEKANVQVNSSVIRVEEKNKEVLEQEQPINKLDLVAKNMRENIETKESQKAEPKPVMNQNKTREETDKTSMNTEEGSANKTEKPPVKEYFYHIVKDGETLYSVSMKYFHSRRGEKVIKQINGLNSNGKIFVGQHLKIPKNR